MSGRSALPSPAAIAALLEEGPEHYDVHIWRPTDRDRPASVLVPLLTGDGELRVLLTRRSPELSHHAGEYSFPGGRPEPSDASPLHTALREAREEVGLPEDLIEIVGRLPLTSTYVTGFAISPFVGIVHAPPTWVAQASEVSEFAEPRLVDLIASRTVHEIQREGGIAVQMPVFPLGPDRAVWGATARILDELLARLAPALGDIPGLPDFESVRAAGGPA